MAAHQIKTKLLLLQNRTKQLFHLYECFIEVFREFLQIGFISIFTCDWNYRMNEVEVVEEADQGLIHFN